MFCCPYIFQKNIAVLKTYCGSIVYNCIEQSNVYED